MGDVGAALGWQRDWLLRRVHSVLDRINEVRASSCHVMSRLSGRNSCSAALLLAEETQRGAERTLQCVQSESHQQLTVSIYTLKTE